MSPDLPLPAVSIEPRPGAALEIVLINRGALLRDDDDELLTDDRGELLFDDGEPA